MADTWNVTSQRQTTIIGDNGQLQAVIEVTYRIGSIGFTGHVDIPLARFNPTTVKEAIDAAAAQHLEIHQL